MVFSKENGIAMKRVHFKEKFSDLPFADDWFSQEMSFIAKANKLLSICRSLLVVRSVAPTERSNVTYKIQYTMLLLVEQLQSSETTNYTF